MTPEVKAMYQGKLKGNHVTIITHRVVEMVVLHAWAKMQNKLSQQNTMFLCYSKAKALVLKSLLNQAVQ